MSIISKAACRTVTFWIMKTVTGMVGKQRRQFGISDQQCLGHTVAEQGKYEGGSLQEGCGDLEREGIKYKTAGWLGSAGGRKGHVWDGWWQWNEVQGYVAITRKSHSIVADCCKSCPQVDHLSTTWFGHVCRNVH